jgi:glycosyltransferase involved in cell wall biosynthesis
MRIATGARGPPAAVADGPAMIHFFPRFAKNAADTPFGQYLRETGVAHRIFGTHVQQAFRFRLQLLLIGYPHLAWSAFLVALRSLFDRSDQPPDAVVISSDVEVLVFALVRRLPFAAKPRIVFMPFIFTQRANRAVNRFRLAYYRFVVRRVSCAICHSTLEVQRYERLFEGCGAAFVFVPWGTYVPEPSEILRSGAPVRARNDTPVVVAAGRSGRDYPTLVAAVHDLPCRVAIICNETAGLGGVVASPQVEIMMSCFGTDYLRQLLDADVVVVPLRVEDISAGQMVMIQAMALARPLVVTQTPTVGDYLEDGDNAVLVARGDAGALRRAIAGLLADPAYAHALGKRAREAYSARLSGDAHMRSVVQAIARHIGDVNR